MLLHGCRDLMFRSDNVRIYILQPNFMAEHMQM
jgi:hypothetical protein